MQTRRPPTSFLLGLAAGCAMTVSFTAGTPPIADVKVVATVATDGRLLVSFSAPAAFNDDVRTIVRSGLVLTFNYTIELRRPSIWFDPMLASITLGASAQYDALTRVYQVSKSREGQVVVSQKLDQEPQVRAWLTEFESVLVEPASALVPNGDYYVRVRLRAEPRSSFSLWPFRGDDASGRTDFTYIKTGPQASGRELIELR